jgi:ribosomal protein L37AE/L43A
MAYHNKPAKHMGIYFGEEGMKCFNCGNEMVLIKGVWHCQNCGANAVKS